jgi:hypothetical protein
MATEIKTKQTFGSLEVVRLSPKPKDDGPQVVNIIISFEEALKLHLGLGQALGKLNSYNRATSAGKRSAINLGLHVKLMRITVNEAQLPKAK